jgi:3-deoxy-D-manno-octulosonate 8-phosphate phosphatase (KDO 8-P phosphatase)
LAARVIPSGWKPTAFVLDVDGVLTTGQFYYTPEGKAAKLFGADDHDGLLLLKPHLEIRFITGDRKGFDISKKRVTDDMKFPLDLVSTVSRAKWISERFSPKDIVYMGDGIFDGFVFPRVGYGICPKNAYEGARSQADYICKCDGGDRAVADACLHLLERFFTPYDPEHPPAELVGGEWGQ